MSSWFARLSLVAGTSAALLFALSSPAAAHVSVSPESVPVGTFTTFTFTVPNEQADEDTIGIDVSLPRDFLLEGAESVAGWKTVVDTRADGTPVAVHWTGGSIAPHTFAEFSIRGRVGDAPGASPFAVEQRYETTTEEWAGPADSEQPAPTVTVRAAGSPGTSATAGADPGQASGTEQVPLAGSTSSSAAGKDSLARSRADLALMLAAAALIVGLALLGLFMRRRMTEERLAVPVQPQTDAKVGGRVGASRKK